MAYLEIIKPEEKRGQRLEIAGAKISLGRVADNDYPVEDAAASSHHCTIKKNGAQFTLTDLDSTNGTFVNGVSIREVHLNPKDIVTIGSLELLFDGTDIEPDLSRELQSPPFGSGVNTVVLESSKFGGTPPAAFAARRNTKNVWVITGVIVGAALAGLIFWFLSVLFKR